jgi:hypothetical protein
MLWRVVMSVDVLICDEFDASQVPTMIKGASKSRHGV